MAHFEGSMNWAYLNREEEARISELVKLIAEERDPIRLRIHARELERLLTEQRFEKQKPKGS